MLKHKIILAFFIFALVPAGAKIYGQSEKGTKDSIGSKNIYQILLNEGIDSILQSIGRSRQNTSIVFDTSKTIDSVINQVPQVVKNKNGEGFSVHGSRTGQPCKISFPPNTGILDIKNIVFTHTTNNNSEAMEDGFYKVVASGEVTIFDSTYLHQFFINKYRKYTLIYENSTQSEPKSFWDSTAKPILVTLGAIAVIALFFLVRG